MISVNELLVGSYVLAWQQNSIGELSTLDKIKAVAKRSAHSNIWKVNLIKGPDHIELCNWATSEIAGFKLFQISPLRIDPAVLIATGWVYIPQVVSVALTHEQYCLPFLPEYFLRKEIKDQFALYHYNKSSKNEIRLFAISWFHRLQNFIIATTGQSLDFNGN